LLPRLANPGNPAMSPLAVRGTGTHHTVETVERGREGGGRGNCLGDELPHYKECQKMPLVRMPCYDPRAHGILTHAHMCRHR